MSVWASGTSYSTFAMQGGLGLLGLEGTFKGSCRQVLGLLQSHASMLTQVATALVSDPTVEWTFLKGDNALRKVLFTLYSAWASGVKQGWGSHVGPHTSCEWGCCWSQPQQCGQLSELAGWGHSSSVTMLTICCTFIRHCCLACHPLPTDRLAILLPESLHS